MKRAIAIARGACVLAGALVGSVLYVLAHHEAATRSWASRGRR